MDQAAHRRTRGHQRRRRQPLRGIERRYAPLQTGERDTRGLSEEDQPVDHGVQVHGEHKRVPRGGEEAGRATAGDVPDHRSVGETEPVLGSDMSAVVGAEGRQLRQALHRSEGGR